MAAFQKTHPWLTFRLDMRRASPRVWMLLGECQSKCQHIAGVPLLPEVQTEFLGVSLVKGIASTTAIEGNTLSEEQVRARLEGNLSLPPSQEYLGREIDNVLGAINEVGRELLSGRDSAVSIPDLMRYNQRVLSGLPLEEGVEPGVFRRHRVTVGRYLPPDPAECTELLERLCEWLNSDWAAEVPEFQDYPMALGALKAVAAHLYLAWIHPFGDGNGRTARLLEFHLLLCSGVPNVAAHLLSNHYNTTRPDYYKRLGLSSRDGGQPLVFVQYALQGFADSLREQVETIKAQQLQVHWKNYVHEEIRGDTPAAARRRALVLDLPPAVPTPVSAIPALSPRLARDYARTSMITLRRDLHHLEELKLIRVTPEGVLPQREIIRAFLPLTRE